MMIWTMYIFFVAIFGFMLASTLLQSIDRIGQSAVVVAVLEVGFDRGTLKLLGRWLANKGAVTCDVLSV